ncbi:hypothetical protein DL96DRAFT_1606713 [Flagelloscypha sp. PMI_526]|nr:hypothetical protein DL96DRAFT_1606713 [Flagelloscypha sp. PMI_526]
MVSQTWKRLTRHTTPLMLPLATQPTRPRAQETDLPPEVWEIVASFLDPDELKTLRNVNSTLFYLAVRRSWRTVYISRTGQIKIERKLKRLSDPWIASKVESLWIRTDTHLPLWFMDHMNEPTDVQVKSAASRQSKALERSISSAIRGLPNISSLSICFESIYGSYVPLAWSLCASKITTLHLMLTGSGYAHLSNLCSSGILFDNLQSLTLDNSPGRPGPKPDQYGKTFRELLSCIPKPLHTLHLKGTDHYLNPLLRHSKVFSTLQSFSVHSSVLHGSFDDLCQLLVQGTNLRHLVIYRAKHYSLKSSRFISLLASLSDSPHLQTLELPLEVLDASALEFMVRHTPHLRTFRSEVEDITMLLTALRLRISVDPWWYKRQRIIMNFAEASNDDSVMGIRSLHRDAQTLDGSDSQLVAWKEKVKDMFIAVTTAPGLPGGLKNSYIHV